MKFALLCALFVSTTVFAQTNVLESLKGFYQSTGNVNSAFIEKGDFFHLDFTDPVVSSQTGESFSALNFSYMYKNSQEVASTALFTLGMNSSGKLFQVDPYGNLIPVETTEGLALKIGDHVDVLQNAYRLKQLKSGDIELTVVPKICVFGLHACYLTDESATYQNTVLLRKVPRAF